MKVSFHKARRAKKKALLKLAKGMRGRKNHCANIARDHVIKRFRNKYIGRRLRKRNMRSLWIMRINAALRMHGSTYSQFINLVNETECPLNRKSIAEMAAMQPEMFEAFVKQIYSKAGKSLGA